MELTRDTSAAITSDEGEVDKRLCLREGRAEGQTEYDVFWTNVMSFCKSVLQFMNRNLVYGKTRS